MTLEQLADLFFGVIQEEAAESIDHPWTFQDDQDDDLCGRFETDRIGNTLHIKDNQAGKEYILTLEEKVKS